jgi:hypothetical protein
MYALVTLQAFKWRDNTMAWLGTFVIGIMAGHPVITSGGLPFALTLVLVGGIALEFALYVIRRHQGAMSSIYPDAALVFSFALGASLIAAIASGFLLGILMVMASVITEIIGMGLALSIIVAIRLIR